MKSLKHVKVRKALVVALMCSWVLSGCGRDKALDDYKDEMSAYYDDVARIDDGINSINPEEDMDGTQLLIYLDELNTITSEMAELEVPKQFSAVEDLADEAAENMSEAVSLYHRLYSEEEYNEDVAAGAYEYYERANLRIRYIRDILHGEMPEDLIVVRDDAEDIQGEE